jgi:hypothetical protein
MVQDAWMPLELLAAILCHVESRVIANDYTFSFSGPFPDVREDVPAGMRRRIFFDA